MSKETKITKTISEAQKLQAFALYMMAADHYIKLREYERAVAAIVGTDDGQEYNDWVSDALYTVDAGRPVNFDSVLKKAGVAVRPSKKIRARS